MAHFPTHLGVSGITAVVLDTTLPLPTDADPKSRAPLTTLKPLSPENVHFPPTTIFGLVSVLI